MGAAITAIALISKKISIFSECPSYAPIVESLVANLEIRFLIKFRIRLIGIPTAFGLIRIPTIGRNGTSFLGLIRLIGISTLELNHLHRIGTVPFEDVLQ